ncbi:MAG: ribonuclease Z, partial [bacterium]|nr:ribonuclease Z [bacterium]
THADHIGGIEELAFYCKYLAGGKKPNLYLPEALCETLWEHSLKGGLEDTFNKANTLEDYFNVHLANPHFEIEDIPFDIVPTFHVPEKFCCGLKINNHIFFSGDTQYDPDMVTRHGTEADIIFHDCQFAPGGIHANLDELASLPESLRSKTWLMHYPDDATQYEQKAGSLGFQWTRQHTVYTFD